MSTTSPIDPVAAFAEAARSMLADHLGAEPSGIEVLRAERVQWPDGSLGCPQPGHSYTQALVDGYKVVLGYASRVYLYHAGSDGQPFLCASDQKDGGHDFVPPPGFDL